MSFGFARVPAIRLHTADIGVDDDASDEHLYRLSWHTDGASGGHRGSEDEEEDVQDDPAAIWQKLLYWISIPGL